MRLVAATLYALKIPFVTPFAHSTQARDASDSVVVRVVDETGQQGFGEAAARPYVTGETPASVLAHVADDLWPELAGRDLPEFAELPLAAVDAVIPDKPMAGALADNASRAGLEVAILDCAFRRHRAPLARLLPPRRRRVVYSGVIAAGSTEQAVRHARQMKLVGLRAVKVKVGTGDDVARVRAVRETLGPEASVRVDANGAWTLAEAVEVITAMAPLGLAAVEQPLPRGSIACWRRLKASVPVPLMADESVLTLADADALIATGAVDYFNIRISKCGGLARSLAIARRAAVAGVAVQVGSQVGETAILSAAGRHLAAALDEVRFVEGSYGTLLLSEDVSADAIRFGHGGEAPLLTGPGLGIEVREDRLRRHAWNVVELA